MKNKKRHANYSDGIIIIPNDELKDKTSKILSILRGYSMDEIKQILRNVKREATCLSLKF